MTPRWLDSSVGSALHRIAEVMGSNPVQAWIFSGFNFTTAYVVCITAMISHIFISQHMLLLLLLLPVVVVVILTKSGLK